MTFLQQFLGTAGTPNPNDERLWSSFNGGPAATGMVVTPETALKISTVWACVGLISDCLGMLPTLVYKYLSNGGRERATHHPLYDVLHIAPNKHQTAFEFKRMLTGHALLRGNAYAQIVPGPRGFADQLVPLHPDRVTPELLDDGGLRYQLRQKNGQFKILNDDEVLHLRGFSSDGLMGLDFSRYARESMGLALAGERSGAKTFTNGARLSGVLKYPGKLTPEGSKRMKESWKKAQAGIENSGETALLEEGLDWANVGMNNKDSQWMESREFQAEDLCRFLRVPPHMVGLTSKATSWGTGIEQMGIGFVIYTLMPWITMWQQDITRDLILAPNLYFVEFLVEALLRGDLKSRYDAYAIARNWGWYSVNDIRRKENENPIPNGDIYLMPGNMIEAGSSPTGQLTRGAPLTGAHYAQLLHEAAARIVRKEIAAISRVNNKHAEQSDDWRAAINEFYSDHAEFVSQTLRIPIDVAADYAAAQKEELIIIGAGAMTDWESRRVADLVNTVLVCLSAERQLPPVDEKLTRAIL